jgi:hypothetical protein
MKAIEKLSYTNLDVGRQSLVSIRKSCKSILSNFIPMDLAEETIAGWIARVNNNVHELENLGGSGLFLTALLMEHSCR